MAKEKELTEEELKKATGGKQTRRVEEKLGDQPEDEGKPQGDERTGGLPDAPFPIH